MRSIVGHVIMAAVLFAGGEIFRRAAHIEQRLALAEEDLATLTPDAADAEYAGVEEEMAMAGRLPFLGQPLLAAVRQEHAMVAYWRGDYDRIPKESELAASDVDPNLVFLAANVSSTPDISIVTPGVIGASAPMCLGAILRMRQPGPAKRAKRRADARRTERNSCCVPSLASYRRKSSIRDATRVIRIATDILHASQQRKIRRFRIFKSKLYYHVKSSPC